MIDICSDCPPIGYPTDKTRCVSCPRTVARELADKFREARDRRKSVGSYSPGVMIYEDGCMELIERALRSYVNQDSLI